MPKAEKLTKRQQIEKHLYENYRFRYNTIKYKIEFCQLYGEVPGQFIELEDKHLHTLLRKMDVETSINASFNSIFSVLQSDFVQEYNPIDDYFLNLPRETKKPKKGETPEIDKLFDCIECVDAKQQEALHQSGKRWLVASVANALNVSGCQNQTCIVLTGDQGAFKTTFLNALCPVELNDYLYSGKIDLQNKDTLIMLGQFFIINIDDQLKVLQKKDAETMKTIITQKDLSLRLPHAKLNTKIRRIANFCGSINGSEFLTDNTGNRRFLPFEVRSIDIARVQKKIDIPQVWMEAYALYQDNFKYWFEKEELDKLFEGFENFYAISPEHEILAKYFEVVTTEQELYTGGHIVQWTTTEILEYLNQRTHSLNLNLKKLGEMLNKLKCLKKSRAGGLRTWILKELNPTYNDLPQFSK